MAVERDEGPRSAARFIEQAADGSLHAHLSAELFALTSRLQEEATNRDADVSGEISLKLRLKAQPNGMVHLGYEVTRKDPRPKTRTGVMWLTDGGNLSPSNPRQAELPHIREVITGGGGAPARDVGQARGAGKEIG